MPRREGAARSQQRDDFNPLLVAGASGGKVPTLSSTSCWSSGDFIRFKRRSWRRCHRVKRALIGSVNLVPIQRTLFFFRSNHHEHHEMVLNGDFFLASSCRPRLLSFDPRERAGPKEGMLFAVNCQWQLNRMEGSKGEGEIPRCPETACDFESWNGGRKI